MDACLFCSEKQKGMGLMEGGREELGEIEEGNHNLDILCEKNPVSIKGKQNEKYCFY